MAYIALHTALKPGRETDYDVAHKRIPGDLLATQRRAGITDWSIWRSGRHLFHLVECDDFPAALRQLEHDPANERWQEFIGAYLQRATTISDGATLALVWQMRNQL